MPAEKKPKEGRRNIGMWLLIIFSIFIIVYLARFYFAAAWGMGDACLRDKDCSSGMCYGRSGRHVAYCTRTCSSDEQCPAEWKCLQAPKMPEGKRICLRP